jgi:hypothetical protein
MWTFAAQPTTLQLRRTAYAILLGPGISTMGVEEMQGVRPVLLHKRTVLGGCIIVSD